MSDEFVGMVYGDEAMVSVETNVSAWMRIAFDENANSDSLENYAYLLDEAKETAHIKDFLTKQRVARGFNKEVSKKGSHKGDLVLKRVIDPKENGEVTPKWEGHSRIREKLNN
ncbi:uncharacterized protein LOC127122603 [Lathyrus oleraceus]|uniref:uncharacterized protein LOC127122603 n=1 Tax=Pisum sativum TaxID=3888 RepID=UPI0021D1AC83|nr:uncharacterized protein LOC127122603 [Pisum sativum]